MSAEIELKLLLPGATPSTVVALLSQCPALAQAQPSEKWLLNRYFDTPDQLLRQQRAALRLRQVSTHPWPTRQAASQPAPADDLWWQTFKTAGVSHGGLSQRGEWESSVPSGELDADALRTTPWAELDPDGHLFAQLQPCFETRCHRTTWHIQPAPGCEIEVALDIGDIAAAGRVLPMLELELELLSGPPQALFDLARQLGADIGMLPCDVSKAERGYALAQGQANHPMRARTTHLRAGSQPLQVAATVMSEMFDQLTRNLAGLLHSDDPELVHQARVAWRRWRSAGRLFRPWLSPLPERQPLRPLFQSLGQLRDLDVARLDTLPHWAPAFVQGNATRQDMVDTANRQLGTEAAQQRQQVRQWLRHPQTGQCWLDHTAWLYQLHTLTKQSDTSRRHWAQHRINKLQRRLQQALHDAQAPLASQQQWHNARLQAKRTRYSLETLHGLLPTKRAEKWTQQTIALQQHIGLWRDTAQAAHLLNSLAAAPTWAAFVQGVSSALQPAAHK